MLVAICASLLIYIVKLAQASGTDIPLDFYTDNACATPSTTAANISLELGVCAVTPGLGSFVLRPYPCSSGDVVQYAFSDTACGQQQSASPSFEGYCYSELEKGDIAAIMLSCDQTGPGQPASTTTISVGPIATGGSNYSTSSTTGGGSGSSSSGSGSSTSGWNSLSLPVRIIIIARRVAPRSLGYWWGDGQKESRLRGTCKTDSGAHVQTHSGNLRLTP